MPATLSINDITGNYPKTVDAYSHHLTLSMIHNLSMQLDIVAELIELTGKPEYIGQLRQIAERLRNCGDMKHFAG